jgi:hypothetical protein
MVTRATKIKENLSQIFFLHILNIGAKQYPIPSLLYFSTIPHKIVNSFVNNVYEIKLYILQHFKIYIYGKQESKHTDLVCQQIVVVKQVIARAVLLNQITVKRCLHNVTKDSMVIFLKVTNICIYAPHQLVVGWVGG